MSDITRLDLPGLNFLAPLAADDFEWNENNVAVELLRRFQIIFGANFASLSQYGIVSDVNPASATVSSPMFVSPASSSDAFTFLIQPGVAVTQKGQLIIFTSSQSVSIPQVGGQAYAIIAKYVLTDTTKRLNKEGDEIPARREVDFSSLLEVISVSDYQLLSSDSVSTRVVLGVVSVTFDQNIQALTSTLDLTKSTYSWNRPWFSPVDYYHRNQKGNPHETTIEELDQGSIPLMQKFRGDGFIIAEDAQFPYFPGHLCIEEIERSKVTTVFPYSYRLTRRPVRTGRLYLKSDPTKEMAYTYDNVNNAITFLQEPPAPVGSETQDMRLDTLVVDSFEPALLSTTARFANVSTKGEAAISQGAPIRTMPSYDVPLNDFGPGAFQRARVYIAADGTLIRSPHTLVCQARLNIDLLPGEDTTVSSFLPLPSVLRLIVRDNVNVSGQLIITGTDVSGAPLEETITFAYDIAYPNGVLPTDSHLEVQDDTTQYGRLTPADTGVTLIPEMKRAARLVTLSQCPCRYSSNVFSTVTSMRLENLVGGSTTGSITLQALLDTRSLLQLAEIIEREGVVESLVDNRYILAGLSMVDRGIYSALYYADSEINDTDFFKYAENFSEPKYGDFRLSNLEDPLNSIYDSTPSPDRPGDTSYYVSRLLPIRLANGSSVTNITAVMSILSKVRSSSVRAQLVFVSLASGYAQTVWTTDLFEDRSIVVSQNVSPGSVDAVRVIIRGTGMEGFVLSLPSS